MAGSTFVSSPLTEEGRFCSITIVNPLLPLCSGGPAWAADKENPPLPDPRSALASPAHFTGEGSLRAAAVHDHPTVPRTHRRALASYGDTLTTPSPAGYYVNIPSLPPSPLPSLSPSSCRPAWFTPNPQNIVGLEAVLHPWNARWANLKYSGRNIITMAAKRAERTLSVCVLTN